MDLARGWMLTVLMTRIKRERGEYIMNEGLIKLLRCGKMKCQLYIGQDNLTGYSLIIGHY